MLQGSTVSEVRLTCPFIRLLLMFHVLVQQLPGGFRAFPEGERSPCARIAPHVPQLTLVTTFASQVSLLS